MSISALLVAAAALSAPPLVAGHGMMVQPKATFSSSTVDHAAPVGTISGPQIAPGYNLELTPAENTKAFTEWFQTTKYTSLKDFIQKQNIAGECGNTVLSTPQSLPATVEWRFGDEGFQKSHEGPCEVWCDGDMAFYDNNCAKNLPSGSIPYKKGTCEGKKALTLYWLALHTSRWQVHINCAAIASSTPSLAVYKHYAGVTLVGHGAGSVPAKSSEECSAKCTSTNGCKAYTWNAYQGGMCWFKSGADEAVYNKDATSAAQIDLPNWLCMTEYNVDFVGNDMGNKRAKDAGECCVLCKATAGCKAYTWSDGICSMKNAKGKTASKTDVTSATIVMM